MAIWAGLGGFVGAYNDSVDAERTAKLKAQAKEEAFEDQKRLAEFTNTLRAQQANRRAILNNLKDMITSEQNRATKRRLRQQYETLAPLTGSAFDTALEDLSLAGPSVDASNNDDKPVVQFQSSTTRSRIRPVVAPVTSNPVS